MRVLHVITRMIIGGAQENTLFNCVDLKQLYNDEVLLVTGPTTGPEGRLLEQGRAGGLEVKLVDSLCRAINPYHDRMAYHKLIEIIRTFRPEVVHTHSAKGGMLGRAAAWACRVPAIVHTVHGAPFHPYQPFPARWFFAACERWAARRCHRMISVADAMTHLLVEARVAPKEKFTTIYSGMDVQPFIHARQTREAARRSLGLQDSDVVIGKIARLFHLKGHEYLVAAAEQVVRTNPACKFLLVGDGILRESLEKKIRELNLGQHFVFTGLVSPEQIPFYLSAMDMLAHTSLREGLARTLPQALIAGLPVISYDVDGAREVVLTDKTGILLPAKSVSLLADAIVKLAGAPQLRDRLGQGGAKLFTDQFRHEVMTARIRSLYCELLNAARG